ncbi:hypothetical protein ElyMa_002316600 [Elysia marginata]|uniref:Shugoshin C-terminal domain-containing protein n=1 Tax=Elysia marginata TaxID=1093978 RepID=A0AAV4G4D5_9GAST|nr:hypothetical protein ElyMa_002316600 [Elysia marginata]
MMAEKESSTLYHDASPRKRSRQNTRRILSADQVLQLMTMSGDESDVETHQTETDRPIEAAGDARPKTQEPNLMESQIEQGGKTGTETYRTETDRPIEAAEGARPKTQEPNLMESQLEPGGVTDTETDRPVEAAGGARPQTREPYLMEPQTESGDEESLAVDLSDDDPDYEPGRDTDESSVENVESDPSNTAEHNQEDDPHDNDNPVRLTARNHARTNKPLTRKRQRDPSTRKSVVRKTIRQSGKQYTNSRDNVQRARDIKI